MGARTDNAESQESWERLAAAFSSSREVSADMLVEWPAQMQMTGDWKDKSILDVGCGTGEKTRFFAEHGAASVVGVDASGGFRSHWEAHAGCSNLSLLRADFEELDSLGEISGRKFNLIVSFQALMYSTGLARTIHMLAGLLTPCGALIFSVPHPFRFAILKNEIEGWGHGLAYQRTAPYRYPSPWKADVALQHSMPRISDYVNAISSAGLRITGCDEPGVTEEFRKASPEKAAWMDRYVGIVIFRAER